jgi:pimeloyl-ACP methyl ester carboxylesterase
MAMLRTPSGGTVKIIERGKGTAAVFLHSGVGSAGEWREVFSRWPQGYRLTAVDAYRDGTGPGRPGQRTLDDYADQVHAVVNHVGEPVHLIGFSWGGATGLHMAGHDAGGARLADRGRARGLLAAQDGPRTGLCRDRQTARPLA